MIKPGSNEHSVLPYPIDVGPTSHHVHTLIVWSLIPDTTRYLSLYLQFCRWWVSCRGQQSDGKVLDWFCVVLERWGSCAWYWKMHSSLWSQFKHWRSRDSRSDTHNANYRFRFVIWLLLPRWHKFTTNCFDTNVILSNLQGWGWLFLWITTIIVRGRKWYMLYFVK